MCVTESERMYCVCQCIRKGVFVCVKEGDRGCVVCVSVNGRVCCVCQGMLQNVLCSMWVHLAIVGLSVENTRQISF